MAERAKSGENKYLYAETTNKSRKTRLKCNTSMWYKLQCIHYFSLLKGTNGLILWVKHVSVESGNCVKWAAAWKISQIILQQLHEQRASRESHRLVTKMHLFFVDG